MKMIVWLAGLLVMAAVVIGGPYYERSQMDKVYVPVTVHTGDTLSGICIKLAQQYGDDRDWREIVYYAQEHNGKKQFLQPGDRLVIELLVERGKCIEAEKKEEPPVR